MYIITRRDLTPGQQIAQVAHATALFARQGSGSFHHWYVNSQYIVVLSVKDKDELEKLTLSLKEKGISTYDFHEPDLNDELTAFAVHPHSTDEAYNETARKALSNLPLAFQERRTKDEIVLHYNKAHNTDTSIPQWVVKHKGNSYYVSHVEFRNVCFSSKETPNNPHTKGSLKFKGKLTIENNTAYIE